MIGFLSSLLQAPSTRPSPATQNSLCTFLCTRGPYANSVPLQIPGIPIPHPFCLFFNPRPEASTPPYPKSIPFPFLGIALLCITVLHFDCKFPPGRYSYSSLFPQLSALWRTHLMFLQERCLESLRDPSLNRSELNMMLKLLGQVAQKRLLILFPMKTLNPKSQRILDGCYYNSALS